MPDTDKQRVADGAAALRHAAIQDRYAGAGPPDIAFGLASVLDMLQIRWRDLDDGTRSTVLAVCELMAPPAPIPNEGTCE